MQEIIIKNYKASHYFLYHRWGKLLSNLSFTPAHGRRAGYEERGFVLATVMCCLLFLLSPTVAVSDEIDHCEKIDFNIPSVNLDTALIQFAEQANVTFMFDFSKVSGKRSTLVSGEYTRFEAIAELLKDTDLQPEFRSRRLLAVSVKSKGEIDRQDPVIHCNMENANKNSFSLRRTIADVMSSIGLASTGRTDAVSERPMLEEIVVTAQKRSQGLQNVPISISTMSGEKISEANIKNMMDLSTYISNFVVTSDDLTEIVSIRGIQSGVVQSIEQSVGTFVDGVYRGRSLQSRFAFLDVERVEILRGPQGTLFGKNTIAGALNITSSAPTVEFEAELSALYEVEHEETEISTYLSGPISDSVQGRFAFLDRERDSGWHENNYPGYSKDGPISDETSARLSLAWDVSDELAINFKYDYGEWESLGLYDELVVSANYAVTIPVLSGLGSLVDTTAGNSKTTTGNNSPAIDYGAPITFEGDTTEGVLRMDYSLSEGILTAIMAHSEYDVERQADADISSLDGIGLDDKEGFEQNSLELRFVSQQDLSFQYIAGLYYQDSELNNFTNTRFNYRLSDSDSFGVTAVSIFTPQVYAQLVAMGADPLDSNTLLQAQAFSTASIAATDQFNRVNSIEQDTDSWAVFSQGSWDLNKRLILTLGLRYSEEEKEATQSVHCAQFDSSAQNLILCDPDPDNNPLTPGSLAALLAEFEPHTFDLDRDEQHWTYTVNLSWDVSDNTMLYGNISNGIKSGGFNSFALRNDLNDAEFEEEEVDAFEVGAKMTLLDGSAELNFAAFYMDYTDLQTVQFTGQTGFNVTNATSADISGFEIDGRWKLTESLLLMGSMGYINFEFDDYDTAACTNLQSFSFSSAGGVGACTQDLSGGTSPFTAEYTANLSLIHEVKLSDALFVRTSADVNWTDDYVTAPDNDPLTKQDSYALWNLSVTLGAQDDSWEVSLVGRNLTDEQYIVRSDDTPLLAGNHYGAYGRAANYAIRGLLRF